MSPADEPAEAASARRLTPPTTRRRRDGPHGPSACSAGTRGRGGTATGPSSPNSSISDISERPRSPRRSLDVMRGGVRARLADAGLAGFPLPVATAGGAAGALAEQARQRQVSASLGAFSCALGGFLVFGSALWSQLLISWQCLGHSQHRQPGRHPRSAASCRHRGDDAFLAVFTTGAMLVAARPRRPRRAPGAGHGLRPDRPRARAEADQAGHRPRGLAFPAVRRRSALRERLARHRRPSRAHPQRPGRVHLGDDALRQLVLGASGHARHPARR